MGGGSRVRLCRALVRAGQPGQLWLIPAAWPDLHLALMAAADDLDAHRGAWRGRDTAARAWSWRDGGHVRRRPGCPVLAVSGRVRLFARPHPYRGRCRPLVQGYGSKTRRRLAVSAGMASMLIAML